MGLHSLPLASFSQFRLKKSKPLSSELSNQKHGLQFGGRSMDELQMQSLEEAIANKLVKLELNAMA